MPAFARQSPDTRTHIPSRDRRVPTTPQVRRELATRVSQSGPSDLQRKPHCACGGGCPRCQAAASSTLRIGGPHDEHEQEADRVAERVMQAADADVQRLPAGPIIQPVSASEGNGASAPPIVHEALSSQGQALDSTTRDFFEPRFHQDFSDVRVHVDTVAAESARAVSATAFTVGRDVVFDSGKYQPHSTAGRELLAHELTHVVQQSRGGSRTLSRKEREPGSCDPGNLGTLGPMFRKPEADVKKLGLKEEHLHGGPAASKEDFVLYCPHRASVSLKKLVPCTTVYFIGSGKVRGKSEVWAQQEGETDMFWGFIKTDKYQDALPKECGGKDSGPGDGKPKAGNGKAGNGKAASKPEPTEYYTFSIHAQRPEDEGTTMGHAWVSVEDYQGNRIARGFYPRCTDCSNFVLCSTEESMKIIAGDWVSGKVCDDHLAVSKSTLIRFISVSEFESGKERLLLADPILYSLWKYNCVDFVRTMAETFGVEIPDFPGIDEPKELADWIDGELHKK